MQISSNYQILPNKYSALNYGYLQRNNRSQYSIQNVSADRNSMNTCQGKINQITFAALPKDILLEKAEGILSRSIVFGPKEYKNLSSNDFAILREYRTFFENDDWKDISDMKYVAKLFANGIHKKYPDGFTLVSIGRSPAFIAKYMEFEGEDVKYCPITNLSSVRLRVSPDFIQEYKKYLDSIGLTADFVRATKRPIVFTDYIYWGSTLRNFESLLAVPEIGINNEGNMYFRSIANIADFGDQFERAKQTYKRIFDIDPVKWKYSPMPTIDSKYYIAGGSVAEKFKKFYENGNRFEENFNTKMMNFILAETAMKDSIII